MGKAMKTDVLQEIAGEPQRLPLSQILADSFDCSAEGLRVVPKRTPGFHHGFWLVPAREAT
jgi:hypothetical protein